MRTLFVVALGVMLLGACSSKTSEPQKKSYTLYWTAQKTPEGGVPVSLAVPSGWKEEVDAMGAPSFTVPGIESALSPVTVVAVRCPAEDCLEKVIGRQFSAGDLATAKREALGDGRVFVTHDAKLEASGGRRRVHARLFQHEPKTGSVVMCNAMLMDDDGDKLPDIRKVCETLSL